MGNPRALTSVSLGKSIPIPDKLRQNTESTRYTKQNSVKVHFLQSVMVQQDTRVSIDVGVRILDFSEFVEDSRSESIYLRHEFEQFIIWEMFQCEFPKSIRSKGDTVEPYIADPSFGEQRVRNQGQHDHSSTWTRYTL